MKKMRIGIGKMLTFFTTVALIIIFIINSTIPVKIFESKSFVENGLEGTLDAKDTSQKKQLETINNWRSRVFSYPARLGCSWGGTIEQKWLFEDSLGQYNDLYCIQSGATHADAYNAYDLYTLTEDDIIQYFGDDAHYKHFMWILENMYTTNTGNQKDVETNLLNKLNTRDSNASSYYNDMTGLREGENGVEPIVDAQNTLYRFFHDYPQNVSIDDIRNVVLPLYERSTKLDYNYTVNARDNFIKTLQNNILLQYTLQTNTTGTYGLSVLNGNSVYPIKGFSDDTSYSTYEFPNGSDAKKFAYVLADYLVNGFNINTYNMDKYKGFYDEGSNCKIQITQGQNAGYDKDTGRVGPYTIKNYYGFFSTVKNVKFGNQTISPENYKVVDANGELVNLHAGTNRIGEQEFYIQLEGVTLEDDASFSVEFLNDYSEVPKATIFIPITNDWHPQVVVNVERNHESERKVFTINVEGTNPDIALKKYIFKVNGTELSTLRLGDIDTTELDSGANDAKYYMRKSPVEVNLGDTLLYRIQTFNEGNVDGRAVEIKDYLPKGLTYEKAYYGAPDNMQEITEGVSVNSAGNIITITNPNTDRMSKYEQGGEQALLDNSQSIYVECKVTGLFDGVYTNVSEITQYDFESGEDIDSSEENWSINAVSKDDNGKTTRINNEFSEWKNYSNNQSDKLNEEYNFVGQEDDDDFDKIIVKKLDLALAKKINAKYVDDVRTELFTGEGDDKVSKDKEEITAEDIETVKANASKEGSNLKHTLTYTMNKKLAEVEPGDVIVSTITIYNEGIVDGAVLEVTDFVPKGLEFTEENRTKTEELNEGLHISSYEYNSSKGLLEITFDDWQDINAINEENEIDKISFQLVFTVSDNAEGKIINSAAITRYGYKTVDGVIEAENVGKVDIDSTQKIISKGLLINRHKSNMNSANDNNENVTSLDKGEISLEDDDDADGIIVPIDRKFDLSLRKYISKITPASGEAREYSNRIPSITADSLRALDNGTTAEYYHRKNKLHASIGELVTYKIRVYNEGQGEGNTGDYAGRATQITDYLPDGLEFVDIEDAYKDSWNVTTSNEGKVITFDIKDPEPDSNTGAVNKKILQPGSINHLANLGSEDDETQYYQEIGLVCKVVDRNSSNIENADENSVIITNRAAITAYEVYDENNTIVTGVTDRDSVADELDSSNLDEWYIKTVQNENTPEMYYPGRKDNNPKGEVEDDNDFDTIYISRYANYEVFINKVDKDGNYLGGAKFETKDSTAETVISNVTTDGTENAKQIISADIENIEAPDVYTITETTEPNGYFKLKNPIEVTVTKGINSESGNYEVSQFTVNGQEADDQGKITVQNVELQGTDKKVTITASVENNTLTIIVPNEKIPETEIHKGVKTVENQDSGYYYQDLKTGTTYAEKDLQKVVHDWVVETTISDGIENYTKYIVTDPIDLTKLEFYGTVDDVQVVKVDEAGTVTKLTKDTDYKISYEEDSTEKKGNLVVEYITQDFKGEFINNAKTGEKLRIVFNTTFRIENGKPVVLGDAIENAENQATLTYTINNTEDVNKKSETPEVHTGSVSVFKYKDVNKNDKYDKDIDKPLKDAVFQVAYDAEGKNFVTGIDGKPLQAVSNEDGIASFIGLEFGGDAIDVEGRTTYDWETASSKYYIVETKAPEGCIKTDKIVEVTVSKDSSEKIDLSDELDSVANREKEGTYNFTITKRDAETNEILKNEVTVFDILVYSKEQFTNDNLVTLKDKDGNEINTIGIKAETNGIAEIKDILISSADVSAGTYYFVITETKAPDKYTEIDYRVVVPISFTETDDGYTAIHQNKNAYALVKDENGVEEKASLSSMSTNENECVSTEQTDLVINVNVPNKLQKFDLSLRKFITAINDKALEVSREPVTDTKDLVSGKSTTAKYEHSKEPVLVTQKDIVEYTIRVYNEGEMDGYASMILDDVPEGVEMIAPNYTPDGKAENVNAEYRWVMCRLVREGEDVTGKETFTYDNKLYVITNEASEADAIVTDYLSFEMGKVAGSDENKNLLKAFDPKVGAFTPDNYRDIKVQFKVKEGKADKLITNHAQIIDNRDSNNNYIIDIDSTPNAWENPPRDDDQDYDVIRVGYFDLALYKWVTTAVVTEDGKTKSYDSSHTLFDKSNVVNINVPKNKINDVVVKFKYQILVENQGVIAGKATEIKDHIPEGLKFVQEDNKDFGWVLNEDGTVSTDYLKDTVLQPNEKTEVTIVLTWINGSNNLGKKTNYAEISQDYNEYNWSDIDSTPNNFSKEPKEDDEDKDVVMLQIKTGNDKMVAYVVIGMVVMTIVSTGVLAIKKFVLSV